MRSLGYEVDVPRLSDLSFASAVKTAQSSYDELHPDVVVGSSRGGAVAMNIDTANTPLVLLAPAWKTWGTANCVVKERSFVLHSPHDTIVPYDDSVSLWVASSGLELIGAGEDHRMNDGEAQAMLAFALKQVFGERNHSPGHS